DRFIAYGKEHYNGDWPSYVSISCNIGVIPYLCCPSDSFSVATGGTCARASYCGSVGDILGTSKSGERQERGFFGGGKVFDLEGSSEFANLRTVSSIIDGTSNTIAVSETVTMQSTSYNQMNKVKGSNVCMEGTAVTPSNCAAKRNTEDKTIFDGTVKQYYRGERYAFSGEQTVHFQTVMPPNSVNCINGANTTSAREYNLMNASSFHSGGVNACKADGSVTFISETIDVGDQTLSVGVTIGESPFGVWGAMGSINGGESKGL
ncbi:MAG: DUF1559 domain-containing protein, partial [Thermoguttaceae bacterium]|nr:DUF1559 domain-containing protein [Thermoguttaceae bacterium]